jgi:GNAT superfamily N-acetyltransferase
MLVIDRPTTPAQDAPSFSLRPVRPGDGDAMAHIVFEAFAAIHDRHRFPRDFPTLDAAAGLTSAFIGHPRIWGVVAERDGRVIGSNFLDERSPVMGVGPITVDPASRTRGVGRELMQAVIDRGAGALGIRLLQDAFNVRSLGLYASLGFEVRDPVVVMGGRPAAGPGRTSTSVPRGGRPRECAALHRAVHGYDRSAELRDALHIARPGPVRRRPRGRIVAYATGTTFFAAAHGAGETDEDLSRSSAVRCGRRTRRRRSCSRRGRRALARCLDAGLRVVKPMSYMTLGHYRAPGGKLVSLRAVLAPGLPRGPSSRCAPGRQLRRSARRARRRPPTRRP